MSNSTIDRDVIGNGIRLLTERMTQARALPNVSSPPTLLLPVATANRIMNVGLTSKSVSLIDMSVQAQWTILPRLTGIPGVANVSIMGDRTGFVWAPMPEYNFVDHHINAKLEKMKILPSDECTDADYVRRIYLDLTGQPSAGVRLGGQNGRCRRDEHDVVKGERLPNFHRPLLSDGSALYTRTPPKEEIGATHSDAAAMIW